MRFFPSSHEKGKLQKQRTIQETLGRRDEEAAPGEKERSVRTCSRARSITACSSRAYFTSRPLARILRASSGVNQVGLRICSSGGVTCSTCMRNALTTNSWTPGGFQKTPFE